jgi:hypothetical protein
MEPLSSQENSYSNSPSSNSSGIPYILGNRHRVHRPINSDDDSSRSNRISEQEPPQSSEPLFPINFNDLNIMRINHENEIDVNFLPVMERIVHPLRHASRRDNLDRNINENENEESENESIYFQKKLNDVFKIYFVDSGEKFYLSGQRYYPKDQLNDYTTAISVIKKEYEGQKWIIKKHFSGLYCIEYCEKEYQMEKWNVNVKRDKNNYEVILSNEKLSIFKFYKCENEKFLIQDALTDLFLMVDKERKRDNKSYFISLTDKMEKASKFNFVNPIYFKDNIPINKKK